MGALLSSRLVRREVRGVKWLSSLAQGNKFLRTLAFGLLRIASTLTLQVTCGLVQLRNGQLKQGKTQKIRRVVVAFDVYHLLSDSLIERTTRAS